MRKAKTSPPQASGIKKRGRPRSAAAEASILSSALEILEERGIGQITIEAVAARAGVGKPTIYRYWANAKELALAAMLAKEPEEQRRRVHPPDDPLEALERQLMRLVTRFSTPSGRQIAVLMASAEHDSELFKLFRTRIVLASRAEGRAIVDRAMEEGLIRRDLPVEAALDAIYGPLYFRLLTGHLPLSRAFVKELINVLGNGLQR